jgi:mono/diheme cytochrome c family protein
LKRRVPIRTAAAICAAALFCAVPPSVCAAAETAEETYHRLCASCHGVHRYGGYAPPLIPQALGSRTEDELRRVILDGRLSTQMPAFGNELDEPAAAGLVSLLHAPVGEIRWGPDEIEASRIDHWGVPDRIPASVRRENVILVVERGTGSVSVLDGDSMTELDRFPAGRIHGGLKFDRAYSRVVAATRDGTVVDYDLARGRVRTRVKVAVNTRNIALSPDGSWLAVANQLPQNVVILDGDLRPRAAFALAGQPSGVYPLPGRPAFVLTLRSLPTLYVIPYPSLALRAVELPEPFEDFVLVPGERRLIASSRAGRRILLYDLDREQVLGSLETEGLPHLFSACFFERDGARLVALNHIGVPRLTILDLAQFRALREIPLAGAGFFVRTHPGTPFLWAATNTEGIQLVDKRTLEPVPRPLVPAPGKQAMHVEFDAEGERALVSVWHDEGAVVIYDARTLEQVGRLPYAMPVGKYNAFNKTHAAF